MTTASLERWREHIETARSQGIPLAHYAKAHGLSRHAMYTANKTLRKRTRAGNAPVEAMRPASPFIAVQVPPTLPASPILRAELPNGVIVQWQCGNAADGVPLLQALAALSCSR